MSTGVNPPNLKRNSIHGKENKSGGRRTYKLKWLCYSINEITVIYPRFEAAGICF